MTITDVIDYCSSCHGELTPWDGETCGCCGYEWGSATDGTCRDVHLVGLDDHA